MLSTRNKTEGFSGRTRKNLTYVRTAFVPQDPRVHVVTQLVNSLLGLVIVPQEWGLGEDLKKRTREDLEKAGLWKWNILRDEPQGKKPKTKTLGTLIWHLRNATAHGRFTFAGEPDSPHIEEVWIIVQDKPPGAKSINWRAEIRGDQLYDFCLWLAAEIETPTG